MITPEKIYVSMTSWYKRIHNVKPVLETILNQTVKPYKIILNLCTEDFPNMEEDLPEDLVNLLNDNKGYIELYWFIENYKAWKKHLHVLDVADDDDLIISVDDDHKYPEDFIEKMYVSYCYYGKKNPVTLNTVLICHNLWSFNGPGTLYKKSDWGNYKKYLTYDVLHYCWEDIFISILFAINNVMILPIIFHMPPDGEMLFNDDDVFSDPKKMKTTEQGNVEFVDMRNKTLQSMEESLAKNYFKGNPTTFVPTFWEIVYKLLEKVKNENPNPIPAVKYLLDKQKTEFLTANFYDIDYKKLRIDLPRSSDKTTYIGDNKLIVTLSSWNKRIDNVAPVLKTICENSIVPDIILLNLAKPDFGITNSENPTLELLSYDGILPEDLIQLMKEHPNIQIHWYEDEKLKSWKKHLYAIHTFAENDVIICIDDDILYSPVFVETMIKSYNYYGRKYAISSFASCFCQGGYPFCGYCTLYTPGFFGDFDKYVTPEMLHMCPEDNHLLNVLNVNNHMVLPVIGRNYLFKQLNYNEGDSNFGNLNFDSKWWECYRNVMTESSNIIKNTCADREEMKAGWNPIYFNFSIYNLQKFIEDEASRKDEFPFNCVYESAEFHLKNNPGHRDELTNLDNKLKDIVL